MAPVCNITSPSDNMENCSFFLDTKYGSITFTHKDGTYTLFFKDGFNLQACWDDYPPKPNEGASPPPETSDYSPSLNFKETSPPRMEVKQDNLPLKATCNLPKDNGNGSPLIKRCNFPKKTTIMLKQWLLQNIHHPYPSEKEKSRLAGATNLSLRQVNDWMINARRRYLKDKRKYFRTK